MGANNLWLKLRKIYLNDLVIVTLRVNFTVSISTQVLCILVCKICQSRALSGAKISPHALIVWKD
jgi:adenine C2-methylase RlmN of 23S rRNA A2503 and tRNA A37